MSVSFNEIMLPITSNFSKNSQVKNLTSHIESRDTIISHLLQKVILLSKEVDGIKQKSNKNLTSSNPAPDFTDEQITRANRILPSIQIPVMTGMNYINNLYNGVYLQLSQNPSYFYYKFSNCPPGSSIPREFCFSTPILDTSLGVLGNLNVNITEQYVSPVLKPVDIAPDGQILRYSLILTYTGILQTGTARINQIPFQFDVMVIPFSTINIYPTDEISGDDIYKNYIMSILNQTDNLVFDTQSVQIGGSGNYYNNVPLSPGLEIYQYIGESSPYLYYQDYSNNIIYGHNYTTTIYRLVWNKNELNYDVNVVYSVIGYKSDYNSTDDLPNWEWHTAKGTLVSISGGGSTYTIQFFYANTGNSPSNSGTIGGVTNSTFTFTLDSSAMGGIRSAYAEGQGLTGSYASSLPYPYTNTGKYIIIPLP